MSYKDSTKNKNTYLYYSNSTLIIFAFATAFYPRLLTYFGAPKPLNFAHFIVIPIVVSIVVLTTQVKDRKQISIVWQLIFGLGILCSCMIASGMLNNAGIINICLQFMFSSEPFLLLIALMAIPMNKEKLEKFRYWISGFCFFNLILALAQSVLLPIGIYPGAEGGQLITDNTAGVFASPGGSAGNYISATVSIYFSLYFFNTFKTLPQWIRIAIIFAALYQTFVSDSKQVYVALLAGWLLTVLSKVEKPVKILISIIPIALLFSVFSWALVYTDVEFLDPYRNFTTYRTGLYGSDGEATLLKTAALRIIPSHFTTPLNYFFGLGPGHTATRLGGWVMRDYGSLLAPLGATTHPVSNDFWILIESPEGWLARDSTMWFPMFTWVGLWGDIGFVGIAAYLYLVSILWRRVCVDDFCKFLLLSTAVFGFILTQMEEPGHMLTVACLLGLRWHEKRIETTQNF